MSDFRFEKHQVAATLVLSTGAMRHGCFFVVTSVTHGGPERVGDIRLRHQSMRNENVTNEHA